MDDLKSVHSASNAPVSIEIGDVVHLKSGSPRLVVKNIEIDDETYGDQEVRVATCIYWSDTLIVDPQCENDPTHLVELESIPVDCLIKVE